MPSYFYHIALELFAYPQGCLSGVSAGLLHQNNHSQTSLSFDSACEALLPFQKRPQHYRPSSSGQRGSQSSNEKSQSFLTTSSDGVAPPPSKSPYNLHTAHHHHHHHHHHHNPTVLNHLYTKSATSAGDLEKDLRLDKVVIDCIDMVSPVQQQDTAAAAAAVSTRTAKKSNDDNNGDSHIINNSSSSDSHHNPVATGIGTDILGGLRTKGRYIPLDQKTSESLWGIVHLYRDAQETPYLNNDSDDYPPFLKGSAAARQPSDQLGGATASRWNQQQQAPDEDCTTLCILAVPSYMSPSDFLGFVGEKTMDDVSHFRMIKTARANRYMVLMKFRSGKKARVWQSEWNGKVFNSMEVSIPLVQFSPGI